MSEQRETLLYAGSQSESARPCGCDFGILHICEWHASHGLSLPKKAVPVISLEERAVREAQRVRHQTPSPDTFVDVARDTISATTAAHPTGKTRTFETGATRDADDTKPDYEGFLSPQVLEAFGRYMTKHRVQSDGSLRASDNWQKGIPRSAYIKSMFRHFVEIWSAHRDEGPCYPGDFRDRLTESLCALMFNVMGYLHEHLRGR